MIGELRGTSSLVPAMKITGEKATSRWQVRLLVVDPHSRSISPLRSMAKRFSEVTVWYFTSIGPMPSSASASLTTSRQRSTE